MRCFSLTERARRGRWPAVRITVRGDWGFAREELMNWCEQHGVDYVLGMARNRRLEALLAPALAVAKAEPKPAAPRSGASRNSLIRPWNRGRGRGGWWARPNICRARPIPALW